MDRCGAPSGSVFVVEVLLIGLFLADLCDGSSFLLTASTSTSETRARCSSPQHHYFVRRHHHHQQHRTMKSSEKNGDEQEEEIGQMRGGLVFLKTIDRLGLVKFYEETIGMKVWLEQPNITILSFGNLLIGFHQLPSSPSSSSSDSNISNADTSGMYTFVYPTRTEVDAMYIKFKESTADGPPRVNERYHIYQFFAKDPEGRALEFQVFLHPLTTVSSAVSE